MTQKQRLLGIALLATALTATPSFSSSSSSSSSSLSGAPLAEFEPFIFQRFAASNIDEDMPSLAQLYQDAAKRKAHLDGFFDFVKTQGLTKTTKGPMKDLVDYFKNVISLSGVTQKIPDDIITLYLLKTDFALERDLMTYYVKALEQLAQNPTQENTEELYAQTVYITRMNLQSLGDRIFSELSSTCPVAFQMLREGGRVTKSTNKAMYDLFKDSLSEEDQAYANFTFKMTGHGTTLHTLDTVTITKQLRELLKLPTITVTSTIFDINSLSFYLNVERALLVACDTLQFEPEKYGFTMAPETHKNRFVLSALMHHNETGLLGSIAAKDLAPKTLDLLKRNKEKLLGAILTDEAKGPIAQMLTRLGVVQASPSKKTPKKPAKPKKGRRLAAPKELALPPVEATLSHALLDEPDESDFGAMQSFEIQPETLEEPQEAASSSGAEPESPPVSSTLVPIVRQVPQLDDFLYRRNTAWIPTLNSATYTFNGAPFVMGGTFFDVAQLQEIKELIRLKPGTPALPNLACARLRFHYRVGEEQRIRDFIPNARYLSGVSRVPLPQRYRTNAHIKDAVHNVLTPDERETLAATRDIEKINLTFTGYQLAHLNKHVAEGPWRVNCADSEAILLYDLESALPHYLARLSQTTEGPLHIEGVVLGVSSYRDPCWRCRNLIQGWQWGLENSMAVTIQHKNLPITLSPDLPTLVFGFGEIAPTSQDFFPPQTQLKEVRLEAATKGKKQKKAHKIRLVRMQR